MAGLWRFTRWLGSWMRSRVLRRIGSIRHLGGRDAFGRLSLSIMSCVRQRVWMRRSLTCWRILCGAGWCNVGPTILGFGLGRLLILTRCVPRVECRCCGALLRWTAEAAVPTWFFFLRQQAEDGDSGGRADVDFAVSDRGDHEFVAGCRIGRGRRRPGCCCRARFNVLALKACSTAGLLFSDAQTMALLSPLAEMLGVAPG